MRNFLYTRQLFALCGELSAGFDPDCDFPLIAGVQDRLILMNRQDIETITFDVADRGLVLDMTLKPGTSAYEWLGQNRSIEPQATLVKGRYSNNFDHEIIFKVFGDGPAVKVQLNKMVNSDLVAIIENNFRGVNGEAAFAIYGLGGGLEAAEMGNPKTDADTDGAYTITLRSSEFAREPRLPNSFFDTDYGTTKAIIDGLVTAPVVINVSPLSVLVAGGTAVEVFGKGFTGTTSVDWIEGLTETNEPGFVVDDDEHITIAASVALSAGTYSLRVTTPGGAGQSLSIIVAS